MPLFWHGAPRHGAHLDSRLRSAGPERERGENVEKYKENEKMLAHLVTAMCSEMVKWMSKKNKMSNEAHLLISISTIKAENGRNLRWNQRFLFYFHGDH